MVEENKDTEKINEVIKSHKANGSGFLMASLLLSVITMALVFGFYNNYMKSFREDNVKQMYDKYYVMISSDRKSEFVQAIYKGAVETGISDNVYVDLLGDAFPADYTKYDLMRIAIESRVDGIIIDADESEEMSELITQAQRENIPVVTLLNDNTQSARCSFVGIGGYEIGREYGSRIKEIIKNLRREYFMTTTNAKEEDIATIDVAILINSSEPSTGQNIIITGITETIEKDEEPGSKANIILKSVDNSNAFSVEESIRDLFINGNVPKIIVCLDELSTACVYQAVIDYNVVGEVNVLGYYKSDIIINAIDRGAVYATVSVDTEQLGEYCIKALNEYNELGATSQYFTADITMIDRSNVSAYIRKEDQNE